MPRNERAIKMSEEQIEAVVFELRAIRAIYEDMELREHEETPEISWTGYKRIRNVITNRLEDLSGSRI